MTIKASYPIFVLAVLVSAMSSAFAQMPGHWESTIVCTHCNSSVGLDFSNRSRGVIVLETQELGGSVPRPVKTMTYSTNDGGKNWELALDTMYCPMLNSNGYPPEQIVLHGDHLVVNQLWGATSHSDDFVNSFKVFYRDFLRELDFRSTDPATLFRVTQSYQDNHKAEYIVSRDSGKSYSNIFTLESSKFHSINDVRIRDTNEIWARLLASNQGDSSKASRLIYTRDQGKNWIDVYPFDTTKMRSSNMTFGNSDLPNEGLIHGAEPGSFYLLQNWSTLRKSYIDLLYTTDYGVTWHADSSHTHKSSPYFDHIFLRNPAGSKLWTFFTDMQTVAYSPDNGKTWAHDSVTFKGSQIKNMLWKDSVTGYILTFSKDSTVTFWSFVPGASNVENHINHNKDFFRLVSSVANEGNIRIRAVKPLAGKMSAFDMLGRIVWSKSVHAERSETIELDIRSTHGVYFLNYSEGEQQQTARYIQE
jgi:photosystem II stability/assembly factor-like uncharacterized protein